MPREEPARKPPARKQDLSLVLFLVALTNLVAGSATHAEGDEPKDAGFQQLLPRGKIAALIDPDFVSAAEAEIPDDAWVLGFAHQGEAYTYDLNILNSHEVVNHEIVGNAFAAVW